MGKFSFKSSGKTAEAIVANAFTGSQRPIGIATPLRRDARSHGIFAMNMSPEAQIADNLRNLLKTNHGERLMITDFGADIRSVLSELQSDIDFEERVMELIKVAVSKWMPAVVPRGFTTRVDRFNNQHLAHMVFVISYDIPALNISGKHLEVTLGAL